MTSVSRVMESSNTISVVVVSSFLTPNIALLFDHDTIGHNEFALNVVTCIIGVR